MASYSNVTPLPALLGGAMLFLASTAHLAINGKVLGISGLAHSTLTEPIKQHTIEKQGVKSHNSSGVPGWKVAAVAGFLAGGTILRLSDSRLQTFVGAPIFDKTGQVGLERSLLGGLLVGFGTKLGNGCTSGHMLCGVSRLSRRSIVATFTFFITALATAQLLPSNATLSAQPSVAPSVIDPLTLLLLQSPFIIYTLAPYLLPSRWTLAVTSFFIALHFSFGLALTGMTRPTKVASFFYFPFAPPFLQRAWDPSLLLIVFSGLLPNLVAYFSALRHWTKPLHATHFEVPTSRTIDWKLISGAAIFGVGWQLAGGMCPGPFLVVAGKELVSGGTQELWRYATGFVGGGVLAGLL